MEEIMHSLSDAVLMGTALSLTVQFMASRTARLKIGWALLFIFSNITAVFLCGIIQLGIIGYAAWILAAGLLIFTFFRAKIIQNILYTGTFFLLYFTGNALMFGIEHTGIFGREDESGWAYGFPANLLVISLCAVFLLGWNIFTRNSLRRLYRMLYDKLQNLSPSRIVIVFICLMIFISMLGLLRIYNGLLQYSIQYSIGKIKFSFYILFLMLPIINILGFLLYKLAIRNKLKLDEKKREYEQLVIYTGIIEELTKDLRAFRHDFNNILLTLRSFVEQSDMQGLREYYLGEILQNKSIVSNKDSVFLYIEYIKCIPLKGLLTTAFQRALNLNIKVSLLIDDYLNETGIQSIDLCRVMGVFLDNAVEGAGDSLEKVLSVSIIRNNEGSTSIAVANSYSGKPEINRLFLEGYSTKGIGRGMGLLTVHKILETYKHVTLNTVIENGYFIQELNISNEIRE